MKVLIARMNHETNTFAGAHVLSAFGNDGPTYDAAAYAENRQRTAMSAFIDLAEARGAESRRCRPRPTQRAGGRRGLPGTMRPHRRRRAGL